MKTIRQPVTRLDYCQYLLVSQTNYTLTYFAEHTEKFSHDAVNHYLTGEPIRAQLVWENVAGRSATVGRTDRPLRSRIASALDV